MPITSLYTISLLLTCPLPHCILFSATSRPTNRLYTTVLQPTGPLSDLYYCLLPIGPVPECSATNMPIIRLYYWSATSMPITRLYTTGLLPAGPLPDCIPLFCYPHAHNQSVYYCSATNMPIIRLYTTGLLPKFPLPDCILLVCYQQTHYHERSQKERKTEEEMGR